MLLHKPLDVSCVQSVSTEECGEGSSCVLKVPATVSSLFLSFLGSRPARCEILLILLLRRCQMTSWIKSSSGSDVQALAGVYKTGCATNLPKELTSRSSRTTCQHSILQEFRHALSKSEQAHLPSWAATSGAPPAAAAAAMKRKTKLHVAICCATR